MTAADFSIDAGELVSFGDRNCMDTCDLCGFRKPSEGCPACGDSPVAARRIRALREGGEP